MVHAVIYCMRGWIAFVAFIEFSNAIRCFIDEEKFLQGNLFNAQDETNKGSSPIIYSFSMNTKTRMNTTNIYMDCKYSDADNGQIIRTLLPSKLHNNGSLRPFHSPRSYNVPLHIFTLALHSTLRIRGLLLLHCTCQLLCSLSNPHFM